MAIKVDDIELIKSFQAGDTDAFTQVVGQYREPLFRHAMRRLNNVAAAEDAVQETFFRAYRAFDRLRDDSRLGPWLHHILANVCADEGKRRTRDTDKSARAGTDPLSMSVTPGIEEQLGLDQDATPMLIALDSLPANYRDALTMRFVDELSYDEMASASGISEQNVRARVSRARTAIRAAMRTVAAVPVLAIMLVKRGSRQAAALEKVEQTHRVATATESTVAVTKMATSLAPAIEQVNALAMSAQHSAPIITKAAIGIGAVALATLSTGPERPEPVPPSAAIGVTAAVVDETPAPPTIPAPVIATAPVIAAEVDQTPTNPAATAATDAPETLVAPLLEDSLILDEDPLATDSTAAPTTAAPTTAAPTTAAPTTVAVVTPPVAEPAPTTPPVTAPPAVVLTGGSISVSGLSVTPSGPRLDVAGTVSLNVGGQSLSGSLSGRLSIATELDASGRQRLEGVLTLSLDQGGSVEVRLAGHATGLDGGGDAQTPATAFTVSGQFRVAGGEAVGLVPGGGFSGSLDPGTLLLTLSS